MNGGTHTQTHTRTHTYFHTNTPTCSQLLSHTHTHTHTPSWPVWSLKMFFFSFSVCFLSSKHTHSHTLSLTHTHTPALPQSLTSVWICFLSEAAFSVLQPLPSLPPSLPPCLLTSFPQLSQQTKGNLKRTCSQSFCCKVLRPSTAWMFYLFWANERWLWGVEPGLVSARFVPFRSSLKKVFFMTC